MKEFDIVSLGVFRWDGPYSSNSIALAKEWVKTNRVFFISFPYTWKDVRALPDGPIKSTLSKGDYFVETFEEYGPNLVHIYPPAMLPINFLPDNAIYKALSRRNNRKLNKMMDEIMDRYQIKKSICFNTFCPWYYLPYSNGTNPFENRYRPNLSIYYSVDEIGINEFTKRHGPRMEQDMMAQSDLTMCTSTELEINAKPYAQETALLHNAADIDLFRKALEEDTPRPAEIADEKRKIIGFVGNLDHMRIDYDLFRKIALHHKDKLLLIIGPVPNNMYKDYDLDKIDNVIMTGKKDINDLPSYLKHIDCAIIPFLKNKLTKSIYPLKINEYLAAGRAVVSTTFSRDIRSFGDFIHLAENHSEFLEMIDKAVEQNSATDQMLRLDHAMTNTWAARAAKFWRLCEAKLEEQSMTA